MRRRTRTGLLSLALCSLPACAGDDGSAMESSTSETSTETDTSAETEADTSAETETDTSVETEGGSCYDGMHAIVTDIDETLTATDAEFVMQLMDSTYDPLEREEASELVNDYYARGYSIFYVTARAEVQSSLDDAMVPARDLTEAWLEGHGFPVGENTELILSDSFVFGDSAAEYKALALMDRQAEGFVFDYAYGNANSDIAGFEMAGIPKDVTFIIGPEAGASSSAGQRLDATLCSHVSVPGGWASSMPPTILSSTARWRSSSSTRRKAGIGSMSALRRLGSCVRPRPWRSSPTRTW